MNGERERVNFSFPLIIVYSVETEWMYSTCQKENIYSNDFLLIVSFIFFLFVHIWMKRKNDHVNHIWITEKNRKMLLLSINCIMGKKFSFLFFICLVDPFDYEYDYCMKEICKCFFGCSKITLHIDKIKI